MAVTFHTIGSDNRVFSASPYYMKITGLTPVTGYAELKRIEATATVFSRKRYANSAGEIIFPLNDFFRSYFRNAEFGEVLLPTSGYANVASKLVNTDVTNYGLRLVLNGTTTTNYSFTAIYGTLQIGEVETTEETIYAFGTLPLTITQNVYSHLIGITESYTNGKDYFVNAILEDYPNIDSVQLWDEDDRNLLRVFNIQKSSCETGTYLRWIYQGQYKYFLFKLKDSYNDTKEGDTFRKELLSLDATNGLYKSQNQLIDISGNPVEVVGLATASYEQQKFIQTLQTSIKVWKHLGDDKWVEVGIKMSPITIDELYQQPNTIEIQVILPDLFIPSL